MPQNDPCPRCASARLSVLYYDAENRPLGGHLHCPDCGARHSVKLVPGSARRDVRGDLLQRKAS